MKFRNTGKFTHRDQAIRVGQPGHAERQCVQHSEHDLAPKGYPIGTAIVEGKPIAKGETVELRKPWIDPNTITEVDGVVTGSLSDDAWIERVQHMYPSLTPVTE